MFHGEVVHGRGREQLAIRHAAEDAKSDEKGTAGVGGGSRTDIPGATHTYRNHHTESVSVPVSCSPA